MRLRKNLRGCAVRNSFRSCATDPRRPSVLGLQGIYTDYLRRYRSETGHEEKWFGSRRSLADAVLCAAKSELPSRAANGSDRLVVHDHQRRVGRRRLSYFAARLVAELDALDSARSFPDILKVVEVVAGRIRGIGALTCYDVAHRIGWYKGISPDAVYLHTGTLEGARALGLETRSGKIHVTALPRPLSRLTPAQAEDVLCIYKRDLRRRSQTNR